MSVTRPHACLCLLKMGRYPMANAIGRYEARWASSGLPSGMLLVCLISPSGQVRRDPIGLPSTSATAWIDATEEKGRAGFANGGWLGVLELK